MLVILILSGVEWGRIPAFRLCSCFCRCLSSAYVACLPLILTPNCPSGPTKIKVENLCRIYCAEKWLSTVHVYHALHHNLTTKTPRLVPAFRKNPCKNSERSR